MTRTFDNVVVFLDLDNTLYSYLETGFDDAMRMRIVDYFVDFLKMDREEANALANDYHHRYGLAGNGLAKHHHSDETPMDMVHYCRHVNAMDYTRVSPNPKLSEALRSMQQEGADLWMFSNADLPHMEACIAELDIHDLFLASEPIASGRTKYRAIDCFDQWAGAEVEPASSEDAAKSTKELGNLINKPMRGAYETASRFAKCDPTGRHTSVKVMVEDSLVNLIEPANMGWITVWIPHGKTLPADAPVTPDITLEKIEDLPRALEEFLRAIRPPTEAKSSE